jgi:hypothetical protein
MRRAMIVALGLALVAVYAVARVAAVSSYVV